MDEHGAFEVGTASGVKYEDYQRTYRGFLRLIKWSILAIVLILVFLAWYAS